MPRIDYYPASSDDWIDYYQTGAGFAGTQYQIGYGLGSVLRSLWRTLKPLATSATKAVGRQALATAGEIASDIATGEDVKDTFEKRGRAGAANLLRKATKKMEGGRLKRSKRAHNAKQKSIKRPKMEDIFDR